MANRHLKNPAMLLKARSILLAAYDLIGDGVRWTQGTLARDEDGQQVAVTSPNAASWCAVGAIERAACEMNFQYREVESVKVLARELMMNDLGRWEGCASIPYTNDDDGGHEKIVASFNRLLDQDHVQRLTRRSEAAMKGWATRRAKQNQPPVAPPPPPPMTFGGTLPTTDTSTPIKKEVVI